MEEGQNVFTFYSAYTAALELAQLSEVLDGADHLRGVAVLVVVPGDDHTAHQKRAVDSLFCPSGRQKCKQF